MRHFEKGSVTCRSSGANASSRDIAGSASEANDELITTSNEISAIIYSAKTSISEISSHKPIIIKPESAPVDDSSQLDIKSENDGAIAKLKSGKKKRGRPLKVNVRNDRSDAVRVLHVDGLDVYYTHGQDSEEPSFHPELGSFSEGKVPKDISPETSKRQGKRLKVALGKIKKCRQQSLAQMRLVLPRKSGVDLGCRKTRKFCAERWHPAEANHLKALRMRLTRKTEAIRKKSASFLQLKMTRRQMEKMMAMENPQNHDAL